MSLRFLPEGYPRRRLDFGMDDGLAVALFLGFFIKCERQASQRSSGAGEPTEHRGSCVGFVVQETRKRNTATNILPGNSARGRS